MTKIILLFLFLIAVVQVIKPLGWPGLKKRSDAWKLVAGVGRGDLRFGGRNSVVSGTVAAQTSRAHTGFLRGNAATV